MKAGFRWINHEIYGLQLFFDVSFEEGETCTGEEEFFPLKVELPINVLKLIAGKKIPEIPKFEENL